MVAKEYHIEITSTARFYTLEPTQKPKAILYALHGYRQLAPYFIKPFKALTELGVKVIAPEGLHRFYIEGYSGRVGASWMTKVDRENDIKDYVNYLNRLHTQVSSQNEDIPFHLLGFSQGGATACRWLSGSAIPFESLTLYASVFPNDFDFSVSQKRLNQIPIKSIFGDSDFFADEATINEKLEWLRGKGVNTDLLRFKGGHEIKPDVLARVWKEISGI